jgi:hypothetical protein
MTARSFPQYLLLNVMCKYSLYLHPHALNRALIPNRHCGNDAATAVPHMNFRSYHQNHGGNHGSQR